MDFFDLWFDDEMFDRAFQRLNKMLSTRVPSADVIDEGDKIKIVVDLPGLKKEDIHVKAEEDRIIIRAERKSESEEKKSNYYLAERKDVRYFRVIPLPEEIDPDSATAHYENGELEIEVNKVKGKKKKEVEIN